MVERGAMRAAIPDWLYARVRSGERFKEFPGLSGGCFIITGHYLPISKRLRKDTFDSTAQHPETAISRYSNGDKGHLPSLISCGDGGQVPIIGRQARRRPGARDRAVFRTHGDLAGALATRAHFSRPLPE